MKDICLTALCVALWAVAAVSVDAFVQVMSVLIALVATLQLIERLTE